MPVLSLVLDIKQTKRTAGMLLEVYLGRNAGRRVLEGRIKRGDVDSIAAALWYCDLRSFTAITEGMSPQDVVLLLNDYFDWTARCIARGRGAGIHRRRLPGDLPDQGRSGPGPRSQHRLKAAMDPGGAQRAQCQPAGRRQSRCSKWHRAPYRQRHVAMWALPSGWISPSPARR
jgi:class 3 adenylate cyclase